jgi:prepilin-type processing-associated H-X9-DG protein
VPDGPGRLDGVASSCRGVAPDAPIATNAKGMIWLTGEYANTLYNHTLGMNELSCFNRGVQRGAYSAGSLHPGGANALFGDGHVAFQRETIALPAWRALSTRDGGESIGQP